MRLDPNFVAKDLDKLTTFYHPEVTIYEGGGIDRGWADYRDHHLAPELQEFEPAVLAQQHSRANAGTRRRVAVSEYSLKAKMGDRQVDSAGLETLVIVKENGAWKIRHSHASSRLR